MNHPIVDLVDGLERLVKETEELIDWGGATIEQRRALASVKFSLEEAISFAPPVDELEEDGV